MMAVQQWPVLVVVLLLTCAGLHCSSSPSVCPESCTCRKAPLLNCSFSGLSSVPQYIQDSVTELDFSHNLLYSVTLHRPHRNLRNVWLGNNTIQQLSLCIDRNLGNQSDRDRHPSHLTRRCVSWAPTLQLLSVERNQLVQLPEGLKASPSLRILQLSFNRISALRSRDLSQLKQLKELHLQHNLITSVHPQMFENLSQLKVLDLSFNMLTSLHPLMYFSLRNIGADVWLGGNRWHCDCSMRSLRRRMAFDSSRGLQAWSMVCALPSIHSGKDLLQLEEDDLNCFGTENRPELHRDVTVHSGSEILLSCSAQDSLWWQSSGQASVREPQAGLFISEVTEKDTGLYVCISEEHKVVSVFNLQISRIGRAGRIARSLPRTSRQAIAQGMPDGTSQERNQRATQCNLTLAVCLSVLITFLVAFIIGVLTRPCIDVLWTKVTKKKSFPATNTVSDAERSQYENAAFDGEEPDEIITQRERRVTFSTVTIREDNNVEYYDTLASSNQEGVSNDGEIECEGAKAEKNKFTDGHSGSENNSKEEDDQRDEGVKKAKRHINKMEFEHIPNAVELGEKRRFSLSSNSSLSERSITEDRITQRDYTTPKSPQVAEDSVQQNIDYLTSRQVDVLEISTEDISEVPRFAHEPFTDWSPLKNGTNPTDSDLWQENGEQFEFSDSVRSTSERSSSVFGSFKDSKLIRLHTSDEQNSDISSSSSYVSEDEPIQYTVNSDQERDEEENIDIKATTPGSSSSSDNENERTYYVERPREVDIAKYSMQKSQIEIHDLNTSWPVLKLENIPHIKRRLDIKRYRDIEAPSAESDSSSSSDSEDDTGYHTMRPREVNITQIPLQKSQNSSHDPNGRWPALNLENISHIKRRLDIKAPSRELDSSSSSDSEDETIYQTVIPSEENVTKIPLQKSPPSSHDPNGRWPALNLENISHIKRRLDIKPSLPTDLSSNSDSEDETTYHRVRPSEVNVTRVPLQKLETSSHDLHGSWPALDLENIPYVRRRLDIKAPSRELDSSSSSDSEDETIYQTVIPSEENVTKIPLQKSPPSSHDPNERWPALNLENIPHIKRRLDVKAPLLDPDSSSTSDSEDETIYHRVKPSEVNVTRVPLQKLETSSHDLHGSWPALDLEHIPYVKRRLDVKAPILDPDSSSSSDSEDETTYHRVRPSEVNVTKIPLQKSLPSSHDHNGRWPAFNLENIPHIKRRLDIKPSVPTDSSVSSDSEYDTTYHSVRPSEVNVTRVPLQKLETSSHDLHGSWPALELEHIPYVRRRLDVKAPSLDPGSSSSSDSEDETTYHRVRPSEVNVTRVPLQKLETSSHDLHGSWPALDLENIPYVRRRLDVKAPSLDPCSSPSSDSEDETTYHRVRPSEVNVTKIPLQKSLPSSHDPNGRWPALDLENIPHIKRHLDIKAPSLHTDSSYSSDSEDKKTYHRVRPSEVNVTKIPLQKSLPSSHDHNGRWPALDLEHIPYVRRRLDVKAPSPDPGSSSSSDSEDEKTYYTKRPGEVKITQLPLQKSQTSRYDVIGSWPALDLENIPHIKRRLDIRALSPISASSSCSDIDDETTYSRVRPSEVNVTRVPLQKLETSSHYLHGSWPALDLEHIPYVRRRLDIKAPSRELDSSSSSDSEDETIYQTVIPSEENVTKIPLQKSPPSSHDPNERWPALILENIPHIKRRLDIKPSLPTDLSSSSDSEDETTYHRVRPSELNVTRVPLQKLDTSSHDLHGRWPAFNLENIPHIKRRLDIKLSVPTDLSVSSDSEYDTTYHSMRPSEVNVTRVPLQKLETSSHDLHGSWPALDLEHIPYIKRRLDIKAPSVHTDSFSSSDSEDETIYQTVIPSEEYVTKLPLQKSPPSSHDPNGRWPALNLENIPHIKRRLDIKAPSPDSDSSSSSDSEDEMTHQIERPWKETQIQKHEKGGLGISKLPSQKYETISYDPETLRPTVNLDNITRIKRRLAIKHPSLPPESLSDEATNLTMEGKPTKPNKITTSYSSSSSDEQKENTKDIITSLTKVEPNPRWPELVLKRRLAIKRVLPSTDSSFSSDKSDSLTTDTLERNDLGITKESVSPVTDLASSPKSPMFNIFPIPKPFQVVKLEKYTTVTDDWGSKPINDNVSATPKINPELQSRWATMNLGISRFRKRLEITSQSRVPPNMSTHASPGTPSSPSSESGTENKQSRTRLNRRGDRLQGIIPIDSSLIPENKPQNVSPNLKSQDINSSNLAEVNDDLRKEYSFLVTEEKSTPDIPLTEFTTPHIRTYVVSGKAPATAPLQELSDSSSSSDNESVSPEYVINRWSGTSQSKNHTSLFLTRAVDDRRDESHSGIDREAVVELNSQTPCLGEESDSVRPHLSLTNIPYVKRALNIQAPSQIQFSSKNNSEDETDYSAPNLNFGVPRIRRRLDIKAPSPQTNNSSFAIDNENEIKRYTAKESKYSSNMSEITDDYSHIAYKRSIMKASLPLSNSFSSSGRSHTVDDAELQTQDLPDSVSDRPESFAPWRVHSVSLDDITKQIEPPRGTTDMDLPSERSWTGISHHLSDFSISIPSRHLDVDLPSPQEAPPPVPEWSPPDSPDFSRGKSDNEIRQDRGKSDVTLLHKYSYPISTRFSELDNAASSTNEIFKAVSENKREKKGLSALKIMSTERLAWDIKDEDFGTV